MQIIHFLLLSILILFVMPQCSNYGKKCPASSPCCKNGWCSSDLSFCGAGCDAKNSYSKDSCLPRYYCKSLTEDFEDFKLINANDFSGNPEEAEFVSTFTPDNAKIENGQLVLDLVLSEKRNKYNKTEGFGATVESTRYMEYGKVTAKIKTGSNSPGIVSAFITRSSEGDEIDYEWVGKAPKESQTNFYFDGNIDYTKMKKFDLGFDTSKDYHTYEIDWKPEYLRFTIDGKIVREIFKNDTFDSSKNSFMFPNKPSIIGFGIWDGGRGEKGTQEWAGETNWDDKDKVYSMYVDEVKIDCFYKGNETINFTPRKQYNQNGSVKSSNSNTKNQGNMLVYFIVFSLSVLIIW